MNKVIFITCGLIYLKLENIWGSFTKRPKLSLSYKSNSKKLNVKLKPI